MKEKQINLISLSLNKTGNGLVYSPTLASTIYKGDILFFTYTFKKRNYFHARKMWGNFTVTQGKNLKDIYSGEFLLTKYKSFKSRIWAQKKCYFLFQCYLMQGLILQSLGLQFFFVSYEGTIQVKFPKQLMSKMSIKCNFLMNIKII